MTRITGRVLLRTCFATHETLARELARETKVIVRIDFYFTSTTLSTHLQQSLLLGKFFLVYYSDFGNACTSQKQIAQLTVEHTHVSTIALAARTFPCVIHVNERCLFGVLQP